MVRPVIHRMASLMRSSLWFRAAYVVSGLMVVVAIQLALDRHGWVLGTLRADWIFEALMLVYLWPIIAVPLRKWWAIALGIAIYPIGPWLIHYLRSHLAANVILAATVLLVLAIRRPKGHPDDLQ